MYPTEELQFSVSHVEDMQKKEGAAAARITTAGFVIGNLSLLWPRQSALPSLPSWLPAPPSIVPSNALSSPAALCVFVEPQFAFDYASAAAAAVAMGIGQSESRERGGKGRESVRKIVLAMQPHFFLLTSPCKK